MLFKLHPVVTVPFIYFLIVSRLFYRYALGTVWGVFVLSLLLYFNSEAILGTTPISFQDLFVYLMLASETTKAAVLSSLITIIGFIVAYATASANWKDQMRANLKVQASSDCIGFYSEASRNVSTCVIYARALVSAVEKIRSGCTKEEAEFLVYYQRSNLDKFLLARESMIASSINCHTFLSKYDTILFSTPGAKENVELANEALSKLVNDLWFNVPYKVAPDTDQIGTFLAQVDVIKCKKFLSTANEYEQALAFHSGATSGVLLDQIVGASWATTKTQLKNYRSVWHEMNILYRRHKG
ncbi:hypothetical protein BTO08_20795 [Photobacterium angustum]|uniref:Uncharacterized protein n=1 Tax=Photobacterium angustum TaxID=661 RepID=A0A2S7VKH9_PHOAN|nr:hypothetical protein BTO08_20795 [Photobacterium angustum]